MSDVNKEKIKKALDNFEDEDYVSSKDNLKSEIRKKINSYLKDKTELENDPIDVSDEYSDDEEDDEKNNKDEDE